MEDGHTVNLALWLDPSVHYWAPIERMESVEVIRGTIITHGPNNNFGVINSRNLSPFGPNETVISSAIGFTQSKSGTYHAASKRSNLMLVTTMSTRSSAKRLQASEDRGFGALACAHAPMRRQRRARCLLHRRRRPADWDTERLRVNDFYGALGFKGSTSDLVVSPIHARQKDNYDEQNFLRWFEIEGVNALPRTMPRILPRTSAMTTTLASLSNSSTVEALPDLLCAGCRPQHIHRRGLARSDRAQRLSRRGHDDHEPRVRGLSPPRPLPALLL